jgi:CDP-2,3-bis-(O-geranylgeranyl)-sn-glycerol synthase
MQPVLILQLLILLAVANGAPVVAKRLLGGAFTYPLDGGALFPDGRPWLGPSKTIRGIVLATLATATAAAVLGFGWKLGALVGIAAMAGDLVASFAKRRWGLKPSGQAVGLDQIPESLFPLLASRLFLPVTAVDIAVATFLFFVGELLLSRLLFRWHLRDRPY